MDFKERGRYGVDWIYLDQNTSKWPSFVNTVMNVRLP
jgi:hypothetical protein